MWRRGYDSLNVTRRTIRREVQFLQRFLKSEKLMLSYVENGYRGYKYQLIPYTIKGKNHSAPFNQMFMVRKLRLSVDKLQTRIQELKKEADSLLPNKQPSRPRVKHDRRQR